MARVAAARVHRKNVPPPPAPAPAPPADGAGARAGTARTARTCLWASPNCGRDPNDAGRGERQAIPAGATSDPGGGASEDGPQRPRRRPPRRHRPRPPPRPASPAFLARPGSRRAPLEASAPSQAPPPSAGSAGSSLQRTGTEGAWSRGAARSRAASLAVMLDVIDPTEPPPVNAALGHPPEERPARRPVLVEGRQLQVPGAIHEQVAHVGVELAQLGVDLADEGGPLAIEPRKRGPEIVAHGACPSPAGGPSPRGNGHGGGDPARGRDGGSTMRGADPEPVDLPPQQRREPHGSCRSSRCPTRGRAERARRQRPTDRRQHVQEIEIGVVVDDGDVESHDQQPAQPRQERRRHPGPRMRGAPRRQRADRRLWIRDGAPDRGRQGLRGRARRDAPETGCVDETRVCRMGVDDGERARTDGIEQRQTEALRGAREQEVVGGEVEGVDRAVGARPAAGITWPSNPRSRTSVARRSATPRLRATPAIVSRTSSPSDPSLATAST